MSRPGVLAAVLAGLLPVLVAAGALGFMEQVRTADDRTQEANVGVVLNGKRLHEPLLAAIDQLLDRTDPEIVVLGNSIANTDFVTREFARALDVPERRIAKVSIPNTMAAHWFVVLKNRVYARGHRPRLVLVVSDLQSLLVTRPRSEASHVALSIQRGASEPELDAKLGARLWALERARENRTVARDRLLTFLRNRFVDVWRGEAWSDSRATDAALARVFADERTDHRLHRRVIPIFDETKLFTASYDVDTLGRVDEGFAPDLLRVVREHGGTLAYVRPPLSPRLPDRIGDLVPDALAAEVPGAFAAQGHRYLDLRGIPTSASQFQNLDHMTPEGGRRFTRILADVVRALGLFPGRTQDGVDLLGSFAIAPDGTVRGRRPRVSFGDRLPNVPGGRQPIDRGRGGGAFPAQRFAFLADVDTLPHSPTGARCSPIRVLEDGVPLGPANVRCEELWKLREGRTCHTRSSVFFAASDSSDPLANGRTYTLALDPARSCEESLWSYPHDSAAVSALPDDAAALPTTRRLDLRAADVGASGRGGEPEVRVAVRARGAAVAEQEVSLADLAAGTRLEFPPSPTDGLVVTVDNRSDHFLLWQELHLR